VNRNKHSTGGAQKISRFRIIMNCI